MKIYLVCNAAMSTGIMQMRLEEEAQKRGLDFEFAAQPLVEFDAIVDDADVVLCSPQIRFAAKELQEKMGDRPVVQMSPQEFGMMNAKAVLDNVEAALNK